MNLFNGANQLICCRKSNLPIECDISSADKISSSLLKTDFFQTINHLPIITMYFAWTRQFIYLLDEICLLLLFKIAFAIVLSNHLIFFVYFIVLTILSAEYIHTMYVYLRSRHECVTISNQFLE